MEAGEVPRIQLGELRFTPPEISAYILRQLKRNAERFFGAPVTQAVITVPAYFNDAQRQATKDAGRMAGLEVLRLVNEPTAAALAYGLDRAKVGTIAVYDLGGGTFDISILKLRDGIFEVQSTNGDTHLGGDDIDNLLLAIALDEIHAEHGVDLRTHPGAVQALRKAAIDAKIQLSTELAAHFDIELPNGDRYQREIPREVFELLIEPVLERTAGPCKQALADAGITPEQIDEVVLVGGSTRIPAVRQLVDELFHLAARGKKPHTELNPDEVVALGAAVQADILAGASKTTEEMLLLDVTPLSLGIEALGGTVARIIQRNSTIPASATEHFTTGVDGQTNVAIHVVQGERELAADCRSLARFDLKGIPPMSAGLPRIEVRFLIDADGILHVSAREQRSGQAAKIEVKPTYGLTDEQVESMILDSFDHAEEDFAKRLLIEARNEAETILAAVERAPQSPAWKQLTGEEQAAIAAARDRLVAVKQGDGPGRHSRSDPCAGPGHAPLCRADDGCRGLHRHSRQDHGCSRRGAGRGGHRASCHGPGGVQVAASQQVSESASQRHEKCKAMSEATEKHPARQAGARHLSSRGQDGGVRVRHACPTSITASRCRFSTWRRTSASFSITPAAASAPAPPATCGSRIRRASAKRTTTSWTGWTWPPTSS